MRFSTLMIGLSAGVLAFAAQAQETQAPPSEVPPPADAPAAPPAPPSTSPDSAVPPAPPSPPAAYNAAPSDAAPGQQPQMVMGQPQPVVQQAPQPPADYPVCSKTVKDACKNRGGQ